MKKKTTRHTPSAPAPSRVGSARSSAPPAHSSNYSAPKIRKLLSPDELRDRLAAHRRKKDSIVFTNGCFDVIHAGHVRYLREARALGDILIVGLNSDDSVRRLKGPGRPIYGLADRAEILAALAFVSFIVLIEGESVEPVVRAVKPDILVKGGDYRPDEVVGAAFVRSYGGRIVVASVHKGRSTTNTLKRLAASPSGRPPAVSDIQD